MKRIDLPRGYLDDRSEGEELRLPDDTAHYVANVLRKDAGDRLELFDGTGAVAVVHIIRAGDTVDVDVLEFRVDNRGESPVETTLFQAIPKGKRWDWILEKASELGVDTIVPLETERTVKTIPDDRLASRRQRWHKKVASAARQCQRAVVPNVVDPLPIDGARAAHDADIELVAHPRPQALGIGDTLSSRDGQPDSVGIWIGPEGGFTKGELQRLEDAGAICVTLGPRILRSDTAGIAALTVIQAAIGDLNQSR